MGKYGRGYCLYCGGAIISEESNFCSDCGCQLRELSPEDAALVPPEDQRRIPMPVKSVFVRPDFFVFQFSPISKGGGYLRKMIMQFLTSGMDIKRTNCNELLKEVCAKENVEATSTRRSIQRFIDKGWNPMWIPPCV